MLFEPTVVCSPSSSQSDPVKPKSPALDLLWTLHYIQNEIQTLSMAHRALENHNHSLASPALLPLASQLPTTGDPVSHKHIKQDAHLRAFAPAAS
jgi:hypothetical protein